jgi:hypothetical protein
MNDIGHNVLHDAAEAAKAGLARVAKGEADVIEGWLEYGRALLIGREKHKKNNNAFHDWIDREIFGGSFKLQQPLRNDQAAAIWGAEFPEQLAEAKVLSPKTSTLRGWHEVWKGSQKPERKAPKETARKKAVEKVVRKAGPEGIALTPLHEALVGEGVLPEGADRNNTVQVASSLLVEDVLRTDGGKYRLKEEQVDPATLSESAQQKLERAIKQHKKKLDDEFEAKVAEGIRERMEAHTIPQLRARADRILKMFDGPSRKLALSPDDYKKLKMALGPNPSDEVRTEGLRILLEREDVLVDRAARTVGLVLEDKFEAMRAGIRPKKGK